MDLSAYQTEAVHETGVLVVPNLDEGQIDADWMGNTLNLSPDEARILANALLEAARTLEEALGSNSEAAQESGL